MIFDFIFGFVFFYILNGWFPGPMPPSATVAQAPPAPPHITALAVEELACTRDPDPTRILRAMMEAGLIHPGDREDFESYSCFAIPGGLWLDGFNANAVCGGVMSATVNAENPDLYPPNERIDDLDRYQMLSFGSNDGLDLLEAWSTARYGPRGPESLGVIDGLYSPSISLNEVYCDDILADNVALDAIENLPPALAPSE